MSSPNPANDTRHDGRCVAVRAPGRLHLGFLDPSATLGRRFGSLGLVIDGLETAVELRAAATAQAVAAAGIDRAELDRAASHLASLQRAAGLDAPLQLHLAAALPAHAGFGSGTQLALAVGRAFCAWHGLDWPTERIARLLGRGTRSGIGIAGFDRGGLLLDGGPGADGSPAPLVARIEPPPDWRVLLILDGAERGLSGSDEKQAIAALPAFGREHAAAVCHEVLMRVLPGAAGGDFAAFSAGIAAVQKLVGGHFAPAQGGRLYASAAVQRACDWLAATRGLATGQTSWGPTGFALLPSKAEADAAAGALQASGVCAATLALRIVAARSRGASITHRAAGTPAPSS
ncbi:MAG TPA: beta-ribofuranosylaminobenzene 5'-phosphate synthase family protein [Methylibium sp.]|uniref:beta-ribofuranosylaminobenzene 5'-phosphate synthase family protein n=1 Tax=Methylibium sp. TaxID=2067992 RepID=UPI002DBD05BD|nr:beta-ribofuranosylaminobenzene 5'-phosphate synthase family protein [Methylibium sp.]HEU4459812.1 beta-ribofuranosylaminobenzene 5'-phosphate synthase family protein [Methylibium sp.]